MAALGTPSWPTAIAKAISVLMVCQSNLWRDSKVISVCCHCIHSYWYKGTVIIRKVREFRKTERWELGFEFKILCLRNYRSNHWFTTIIIKSFKSLMSQFVFVEFCYVLKFVIQLLNGLIPTITRIFILKSSKQPGV